MKSAVTASGLIYECMLIRLSLLRGVQAKMYDPLRLLSSVHRGWRYVKEITFDEPLLDQS